MNDATCCWLLVASGKRRAATHQQLATRNQLLGLTLVELLVAAVIGTLAMGGLYAGVASGLTAVRRVEQAPSVEAAIALDRFAIQFANSPPFRDAPFEGAATRAAFPSLIDARGAFGRVEYYWDEPQQAFCVREFRLGESAASAERCVVRGVTEARMEYLTFDLEGRTFAWAESWETLQGRRPWAMRVTLTVEGAGGKVVTYTKTAVCPVKIQT